MDITANIPSGPAHGGLTTKQGAAIRVAKAVAAREARAAQQQTEQAGVAAEQSAPQPTETFGQAVIRAGAPELTRPDQAKLELDIDPETKRVIGRIVNKETGEVINQIPSDAMLRLIEAAEDSYGNLLDKKF